MGLLDDPMGTISGGADAAADMGGAVVDAAQDTGEEVVEAVVDATQDAGAAASDEAAPIVEVIVPIAAPIVEPIVEATIPTVSVDVSVDLGGVGPKVVADGDVTWGDSSVGGSVDYGRGVIQVDGDASTTLIAGDELSVEGAAGTEQVGVIVTEELPGVQVDAGPLHVTLDPISGSAGGMMDVPDGPRLPEAPDSVTVGLPGGQADAGPVHVTLDPVEATIPVGDAVSAVGAPSVEGPDVGLDVSADAGPGGASAEVTVTGVDGVPDASDLPPVRPVVDVDGEIDGVPGDGAIGVDVDLGVQVGDDEVGLHTGGRIVDDGEGTSVVQTEVGAYGEADGDRVEVGGSVDRTTSGDETQVDAGVYVEDDGTRSEVGVTQTHTGDWDDGTYDPTRNDEGVFVEHGDERVEVGVTKSENEDWAHDTERGVYVEVDGERTEVGRSTVEGSKPFESASGGDGLYVEQGDDRWDVGHEWKVGEFEDGSTGIRVEVDPGPVTVHAGGTAAEDGTYQDNNGVDIDDPAAVGAIEDDLDVVIDGIDDPLPLPGAAGADGADGAADPFPDEFPELPDDLAVDVAVHDPLGDVLPNPAAVTDELADAIDTSVTDQPADDGGDDWSIDPFDVGTDDGADDEEDDGTNGDQGLLNSMGDAIGGAFGAVGDVISGLFD